MMMMVVVVMMMRNDYIPGCIVSVSVLDQRQEGRRWDQLGNLFICIQSDDDVDDEDDEDDDGDDAVDDHVNDNENELAIGAIHP